MITKLRQAIANRFARVVDAIEIGLFALGAGTALLFGKLLAALVFALLAAGVVCRLFRRNAARPAARPLSVWVSLGIAAFSAIETVVVVESINLPIRFDQAGFEKSNLLLVLALLIAFYVAQRALVNRAIVQRSQSSTTTAVRQ